MGVEHSPKKLVQIKTKDLPFIFDTIFDSREESVHDHAWNPDLYEKHRIVNGALYRVDKLCYLINGQPETYCPTAIESLMLGKDEDEKAQLVAATGLHVDRHTAGVANGVLMAAFEYDFERATGVMDWEGLIDDNDLPPLNGLKPDITKIRRFVAGNEFKSKLFDFSHAWFEYSLYGDEPKPLLHSRFPTFWNINYVMNLDFAGLNIPVHLNSVSYDPENPENGVEVSSLKIAGKPETELQSEINFRAIQLKLLAAEMLTNSHIDNHKSLSSRIIDKRNYSGHIPRAYHSVVYWERVFNPNTGLFTANLYQFEPDSRQEFVSWLQTVGDALNPRKPATNEEFAYQPTLL